MAQISLDLNQFKAEGIYFIEQEGNERTNVSTSTLPLVVGFSQKGPINTVSYLTDPNSAKRVYGDIDPILESRGSHFHRSLFELLRYTPVLALNLVPINSKPLSDGGDSTEYMSFSLSTGEANGKKSKDLYESFFDTQRFWKPSEVNSIAVIGNNAINAGKLLNFINLGQKTLTVLVRKTDVNGYDVNAREWYTAKGEDVPPYIHEWDLIKDYFVEVHVINGSWTNYAELSQNPVYSKYFNSKGLKSNKYKEFLTSESVTKIASFVGCVLPNFVDGNNVNQSIDVIMNNALPTTGLFVALDNENFENYDESTSKVDMVGHKLGDFSNLPDVLDFLSYKKTLVSKFDYPLTLTNPSTFKTLTDIATSYDENSGDEHSLTSLPLGGKQGILSNVLVIKKPSVSDTTFTLNEYNTIKDSLIIDQSVIKLTGSNKWGIVRSFNEILVNDTIPYTELRITYSHSDKDAENDVTPYTVQEVVTTVDSMKIAISGDKSTDVNLVAGSQILVRKISDNSIYFYVTIKTDGGIYDEDNLITYIAIENSNDLSTVSGYENLFEIIYTTPRKVDLTTLKIVFEPNLMLFTKTDTNTTDSGDDDYYTAYYFSNFYSDYLNAYIASGDKLYISTNETTGVRYIKIIETIDSNEIPILQIRLFNDADLNSPDIDISGNVTYPTLYYFSNDTLTSTTNGTLALYSGGEDITQDLEISSWNVSKNVITLNSTEGVKPKVGEFLVSRYDNGDSTYTYYMTKILSKKKIVNSISGEVTYEVSINEPAYIKNEGTGGTKYVVHFTSIENICDTYQLHTIKGLPLTQYHLPGTKLNKYTQMDKILGVLEPENSNLFKALTNTESLSIRYIVDTFDGGLQPQLGSKNVLTRLAKARVQSLAFVNIPSAEEFSKSTDPIFTDAPNPSEGRPKPPLDVRYIVEGGNKELGGSFEFSLPDEENGSKHFATGFPYLTIRQGSKNIKVPPAAHLCSLFVRKHKNGRPYVIAAGVDNGLISDPYLVGTEMEIYKEDRAYLSPFGINPIVKVPEGVMVYANKTGFQKKLSPFNSLHVRDNLITIEQTVEDILRPHLFQFNTDSSRFAIKVKIDSFLNSLKSQNVLYDYKVIFDRTNNTNEIIDNRIGLIDIWVEFAQGLEKFVNRITVFETGGISSGGFTQV